VVENENGTEIRNQQQSGSDINTTFIFNHNWCQSDVGFWRQTNVL